ncbi:MAG: carboxyl transferase domain-containing protein [Pseudomonadota bacterium]|nr:carboxyl transferase domain-containing protein [Pseudomonadota bacterium]
MNWKKEIDELRKREKLSEKMGGAEKLKKQKENNRLNIRERIKKLLDDKSFHEIGKIAGNAQYNKTGDLENFTPANFIVGRGKINKKNVVIGGDDFTVRGGAADASIREKQIMAEQMANELQLPLIRLIEGTGGGGSVKSIDTDSRTYIPANPGWEWVIDNLSTVPVIALGLGPVAGLGAARLVTSHFSIMVENVSQLFVAGPPVVKRLGQDLTKEELGGSEIHSKNGAVDIFVKSEDEAFEITKKILSYLPQSVYELPQRGEKTDDPERKDEWLLEAIPKDRRKIYKMRKIINTLVDKKSFIEVGKNYGQSVITGLARFDGWPVALLAGDPYYYGGGWTADSSNKVTRFIDVAETFHLPVINLVDNPGFLIGLQSEKQATIRHGARALAAVYQATVPWCSVIIRKVFGVAGAAHMNASRYHYRFAWPSGDWGSLPVEGGIEAAYKSDLEKSDNPELLLKEIEEKMEKVRSPFRTAEAFIAEEIIEPRDTRKYLSEFVNLTSKLRKKGKTKFGLRP